jgi:ABC-type transport system involved in cytochrome c biogenesis permease component
MTFLPIVARELRVASRRRATYTIRAGAALLVILLGTWCFLAMRGQPPHVISQYLFGILSGSAMLYCLLSGVRSTSDCLSEEKRDGTLGLLFLTDLKGYDVVLGKLAANSLNAFYGVLAVVPMLAFPLLLGGVTLGEFGRAALLAINTMFLSLSIGMCVSSMCRSARKAIGMTFLVILLLAAGLPAAGAWVAYHQGANRIHPMFLLPSPGYSFFSLVLDSTGPGRMREFWWSTGIINGLGWLGLILATIIAPQSWKDRPSSVGQLRWRERWQRWSFGDPTERAKFRQRLLDANAFFWLAARDRLKPAWVWAVFGLMGCGWLACLFKYEGEWLTEPTYVVTGIVLNLLMKGWFAAEAGRQLADERKNGTLELLLSTPLTVRDILGGGVLSLSRQFLGPLVVVLITGCVLFIAVLRESALANEQPFWVTFWIGGMLMLIIDLVALYWVGTWKAISARNVSRAASASLVQIIVVPAAIYATVFLVFSLVEFSRGGGEPPGWKILLGLWFGLGLAADAFFGFAARRKVLDNFRILASQRYQSRPGLWARLFGGGHS